MLELSSEFADEKTPYGLLDIARKFIYDQEATITDEVWEKIRNLDLCKLEYYYGDLLFARMKCNELSMDVFANLRSEKISRLSMYLLHAHKELWSMLNDFLEDEGSLSDHDNKSEIHRVKTAILYAILQQDSKLNDEDYMRYFSMYVEVGIAYLEQCYNPKLLEVGNTVWARTSSDSFLLVMRWAQMVKENGVEYVKHLREALAHDESMKRGIDLLVKALKEKITRPELDELGRLKKSIQDTIKEAINEGELETATALIDEYEDAVGIDAPLCSAKGIIRLIDGRLEEAERVFLSGLEIDPNNTDLLYNLGYLYEIGDKPTKSIKYYTIAASKVLPTDPLLKDVQEAFTRLYR